MVRVTITINGQKVEAQAGQTVLAAARAAGFDIPTLCHHPALAPIGACRICLVEIAGQRALQPACTFPVADRMVVETESPRVVAARKFVLGLLFTERNHFCMACPMSGGCELQELGYRYGLDRFLYPTYTEPFPVDATPRHHLLDHNRCVLCRRCVRACAEIAANHTLDLRERGAATRVAADLNAPLGESSCVSCGTCVDVCPTGALVEKRRAFMARPKEGERLATVCTQCSLGCGMYVVRHRGQVIGIESRWQAEGGGGLLCARGRFEALADGRPRALEPQIRRRGTLVPLSWDEALTAAAAALAGTPAARRGGLVSTRMTNEGLGLLQRIFRDAPPGAGTAVAHAVAVAVPAATPGRVAEIPESDRVLLAEADPAAEQPVASFLVRRAIDRGARLAVLGNRPTALGAHADQRFERPEVEEAAVWLEAAERPMVLYGPGLERAEAERLCAAAPHARFVPLHPGANTARAAALGLDRACDPAACATLLVAAGEEPEGGLEPLLAKADRRAFVILLTSYVSALCERADLVLPMATWLERSGGFTATDGTPLRAHAALPPRGESRPDWDILGRLAERLENAAG